jgi:uncharacterized protein (UPF0335 family)
MATTAAEVNKKTRKRREEAAAGQPAFADIKGDRARADARLDEANDLGNLVVEKVKARQAILDDIAEIRMGAKALTKEISSLYDRSEELGFDRKCFKDMVALKQVEADQRIKYEASRKQLVRGFGFESGEQLDAFIREVEKEMDAQPTGELAPGQADSIAAHIALHGTTDAKH